MSELNMQTGKSGNRFLAYLAEHRQLADDAVFNDAPQASKALFLSRSLDNGLYGPLRRFTSSGGKRVRPVLVMLGCEAVGGDPALTVPVGYAVEYFQSAVVIHDDVEDGGERRRGRKTLHLRDGEGLAINQGDLALVAGYKYLLNAEGFDDSLRMRLLRELVDMEMMHLEGQALDLSWVSSGTWDVAPEEYLYMALSKTAAHTAGTPLAMGAICGGGTEEQVRSLRDFGLNVGSAYQLQDDLLNLVGEPGEDGKDYRSDITAGKRTLITVHALFELEGTPEYDELVRILDAGTSEPDQLERAVHIMREAGSIEAVYEEAERLVSEGKDMLSPQLFDHSAYEALISFADYCIARTS